MSSDPRKPPKQNQDKSEKVSETFQDPPQEKKERIIFSLEGAFPESYYHRKPKFSF